MNPHPPPIRDFDPQVLRDAEHIRLLSIFHYVVAGLTALGASVPILHVIMGFAMVSGKIPMTSAPASPGAPVQDMSWMGWVFVGVGGAIIVLGWAMAILTAVAGKSLSERRRPTLIFVVACVNCLGIPFGTVLGVFTILLMQRRTVKRLFEETDAAG